VNDHLATKAVRILPLVVRVVPVRACWVGDEGVRVRISGLDSALSEGDGAIGLGCALLEHAMKMKRCSLVPERIFGSDNNGVT